MRPFEARAAVLRLVIETPFQRRRPRIDDERFAAALARRLASRAR